MLFSNQTKPLRPLLIVLLGHILLLSSFFFTKRVILPTHPSKPISVITIQMQEPPPVEKATLPDTADPPPPSSSPPSPPPKEEEVVKEPVVKASPPPVKKENKKPAAKKSEIKPKPKSEGKSQKTAAPKKESTAPKKSAHEKELQALLQKSLDQSKSGSGKVAKKEIPLTSEALSLVSSFEEELVVYLQNQLSVPEPGLVTLHLTLNASGAFMAVEITKCELKSNRAYLESILPKMVYPSFSEYFPKEKSRRFSLTFHVK